MKRNILALIAMIGFASALPVEDLVTTLPDYGDLSFGFYSGYVPIDGTKKQLHYAAALSQGNPKTDPVILWFNGGPGCSSMLGLLQEHGPYVMEDGATTFTKNDYSWNQEATMIYLESPAGVGFSICGDIAECAFTDDNVAADNLVAIINLFKTKFPEFVGNDFYLSGESYGGIYVPLAAYQIDAHNTKNPDSKINLKGYLVGNGVTNWKYDTTPALVETAYFFGILSDDLYDRIHTANCDYGFDEFNPPSKQCQDYNNEMGNTMAQLNIYNLIGTCYTPPAEANYFQTPVQRMLSENSEKEVKMDYFTADRYTRFLKRGKQNPKQLQSVPPCVYGLPIQQYLARADIRQALHILAEAPVWDLCKDDIDYTDNIRGSQWVYEALRDKYRMLKYSGDVDGSVPTLGTRGWISNLNWPISDAWRPYYIGGTGTQVAGYTESRSGGTFTLGTIHGAGHMAPQWKRAETYYLVFQWVKGLKI